MIWTGSTLIFVNKNIFLLTKTPNLNNKMLHFSPIMVALFDSILDLHQMWKPDVQRFIL